MSVRRAESAFDVAIVHLEDEPYYQGRLQDLRPAIEKSIQDFMRVFGYSHPREVGGDFTPHVRLEISPFASLRDMCDGLLDESGRPTNLGSQVVLFLLDYYVPLDGDGAVAEGARPPEILAHRVGRERFPTWLSRNFPHVPVMLLTIGHFDRLGKLPESWVYEPKGILDDELVKHLHQYYERWWFPHFASALDEYGRRTGAGSWHTPGHNAGNAFARSPVQRGFYLAYGPRTFQTDLSVSVDDLGDLSEPDLPSPLMRAQRLSAEIFGAEETFYVTNGTSTSNKAILSTLLRPGDVVLLDRNCHKSVHQAVVMSGALPDYLSPAFNKSLGIWAPLELEPLVARLTAQYAEGSEPRMLILTSCTYEGILYPVAEIAARCEERGILFLADEAWAPYLRFHPFYQSMIDDQVRRLNATDGGAHFAVQSTHKALAAFSQASMIHVGRAFRDALEKQSTGEWDWLRQRFDFHGGRYRKFRHELLEVLRYWHSTSPHYPMLATLDRAGVQMRIEGTRLVEERLRWVEELVEVVDADRRRHITSADILGHDHERRFPGYLKDPLKLLLRYRNGEARRAFEDVLRKEHLLWEKATDGCVQFLVTIGTLEGHLKKLREVVLRHGDLLGPPSENPVARFDRKLASGQVEVLPRDAAHCHGELQPVDTRIVGRICAQMLVPYPPGIPLFLPGLRITDTMVASVRKAIRSGTAHSVHGLLSDGREYYLKVLTESEEGRLAEELRRRRNAVRADPRAVPVRTVEPR